MQPSSNHNNFLICTIFVSQNFCIFNYRHNMIVTSHSKFVCFFLTSIIYFLLQISQNNKIIDRGLCTAGQNVLDLGTGTGVLPRNLYRYGAKWTATDISENQIEQAKLLSKGMDIDYYTVSTENIRFPDECFDVITACQCFWYFDHTQVMPNLSRMLKPGGSLLVLYMAWLPYEDKIAEASEKLVLKYSPKWSGAGETVHPIEIPDCYRENF